MCINCICLPICLSLCISVCLCVCIFCLSQLVNIFQGLNHAVERKTIEVQRFIIKVTVGINDNNNSTAITEEN